MLVVGLRRAEATKQVETSGTRRSPRLTKQLPHYPVVNGANYANISTTRCATASPLFGARTEKERGRFVDSCNKVIDLPRGDVSMRAQLALRVELSKVCASFLPVSIGGSQKGSAFLGIGKNERSIWFLFSTNEYIFETRWSFWGSIYSRILRFIVG